MSVTSLMLLMALRSSLPTTLTVSIAVSTSTLATPSSLLTTVPRPSTAAFPAAATSTLPLWATTWPLSAPLTTLLTAALAVSTSMPPARVSSLVPTLTCPLASGLTVRVSKSVWNSVTPASRTRSLLLTTSSSAVTLTMSVAALPARTAVGASARSPSRTTMVRSAPALWVPVTASTTAFSAATTVVLCLLLSRAAPARVMSVLPRRRLTPRPRRSPRTSTRWASASRTRDVLTPMSLMRLSALRVTSTSRSLSSL